MSQLQSAGYFRNGMPYNRRGHGPRPLIVFQGLMLENKPQAAWVFGLATAMYKFLDDDYTVYSVLRKPGMPQGYTMQDMAADYAVMIREEFGGPVDVLGISTGGSIVQHFAADHPDLVVTIEAEDKHNFKDRLREIVAPTLVVAGGKDPFYTEALFRETAEGIPHARLILYKGMGHPAAGKQFEKDVLNFLKEGM